MSGKNKRLLSILVVFVLLATTLLVSPIINANNLKNFQKNNLIENTNYNNIYEPYSIVMDGIYGRSYNKEEWKEALIYLYKEGAKESLKSFYGEELTNSLDYFLNYGQTTENLYKNRDEAVKHYKTIMSIRNEKHLPQSDINNMKNNFEETKTWECNNVENFLSRLDKEKKEQVESMYFGDINDPRTVANDIVNNREDPYSLMTQIKNNLNITQETFIFILQLLFAITCGVVAVMVPGGIIGVCAIEGLAVSLGTCGILGDVLANIGSGICDLIPEGLNPFSEDGWGAICSFILGSIVFVSTFLILASTPLMQSFAIGVFFFATMEIARIIGNQIWNLEKQKNYQEIMIPNHNYILERFFPNLTKIYMNKTR